MERIIMRMIYRKAATLVLLVSIWVGIIIIGYLIQPNKYTDSVEDLQSLAENPAGVIPTIVKNAFSSSNTALFGGLLLVGAASSLIISNYFIGGGFSALFAIPLLLVFAMIQLFVLPTAQVLSEDTPAQIQVIYTIFIGTLTILTAITFTSGRS